MFVKVTYWSSENGHSKPIVREFTKVSRVYDHYSSWSDLDYIAIETDKTTKYIIREDITHIEIKGV